MTLDSQLTAQKGHNIAFDLSSHRKAKIHLYNTLLLLYSGDYTFRIITMFEDIVYHHY